MLRTCRAEAFFAAANLNQIAKEKFSDQQSTHTLLTGRVKNITHQNSGIIISLKNAQGNLFEVLINRGAEPAQLGLNDTIVVAGIEREPLTKFERFFKARNAGTTRADHCGILLRAAERAFLKENSGSPIVIAKPLKMESPEHSEIHMVCEPIHGPKGEIRAFKGANQYTPSLGVPFMAAVTFTNGHQYITVGDKCKPLTADVVPYIFC